MPSAVVAAVPLTGLPQIARQVQGGGRCCELQHHSRRPHRRPGRAHCARDLRPLPRTRHPHHVSLNTQVTHPRLIVCSSAASVAVESLPAPALHSRRVCPRQHSRVPSRRERGATRWRTQRDGGVLPQRGADPGAGGLRPHHHRAQAAPRAGHRQGARRAQAEAPRREPRGG
jgi:hypothetical protein